MLAKFKQSQLQLPVLKSKFRPYKFNRVKTR